MIKSRGPKVSAALNKFAYPPNFFSHCRKSEVGENYIKLILRVLHIGQPVQK